MTFTIYHGCPSRPDLTEARNHAPSYTHGAEWSPQKMTPVDCPYILDNGAFSAFANGEPWDTDAFVRRLGQLEEMPRPPEFVVLPDVVTDPGATEKRARAWSQIINWPTAYPVQDGVSPGDAADVAAELDAAYLFIGGTTEWKRRNAAGFVNAAHGHGLNCHIGRPGDLTWAEKIGADSVDTVSIVRNKSWSRLRELEAGQQTLEANL